MGDNASSELKHWGILGMKWGVRRFQNKDGTLTEEGKERKYKSAARKIGKHYDIMSKLAISPMTKEALSREKVRAMDKVQTRAVKFCHTGLSIAGGLLVSFGMLTATNPEFRDYVVKGAKSAIDKGLREYKDLKLYAKQRKIVSEVGTRDLRDLESIMMRELDVIKKFRMD